MTLREPTTKELFRNSHNIELLKLQSTHFANQSLANGGITKGLLKLPTNIIISPTEGVLIETKVARSLSKNYITVNWRPLLLAAFIGGVLIFISTQIHQKNKRTKNLKK